MPQLPQEASSAPVRLLVVISVVPKRNQPIAPWSRICSACPHRREAQSNCCSSMQSLSYLKDKQHLEVAPVEDPALLQLQNQLNKLINCMYKHGQDCGSCSYLTVPSRCQQVVMRWYRTWLCRPARQHIHVSVAYRNMLVYWLTQMELELISLHARLLLHCCWECAMASCIKIQSENWLKLQGAEYH